MLTSIYKKNDEKADGFIRAIVPREDIKYYEKYGFKKTPAELEDDATAFFAGPPEPKADPVKGDGEVWDKNLLLNMSKKKDVAKYVKDIKGVVMTEGKLTDMKIEALAILEG